MEATLSSEFQWETGHYIPEDRNFHNHHCENLKSHVSKDVKYLLMHGYVYDDIKVKLFLCLIKHYNMKKYGGMHVLFYAFSALDGWE
jgi:hypothetical protein